MTNRMLNERAARWAVLVAAWSLAVPALAANLPPAHPQTVRAASAPVANDAAAVPPAPDVTPYLGQLERIKRMQRESVEIKQQLDLSKLRNDLEHQQGAQGDGTSPYVLALTGVSGARRAQLVVPGFGRMTVSVGDRLPNGWRIEQISDQAVLARPQSGVRVQLPFYSPR